MKKPLIDAKDIEILKVLIKDSRQTGKQVAEKVGLSLPPTIVRIQKLIANNVIRNFTLGVNEKFFHVKHKEMIQFSFHKDAANNVLQRVSDIQRFNHICYSQVDEENGNVSVWAIGSFPSKENADGIIDKLAYDLPIFNVKRLRIASVLREWEFQPEVNLINEVEV